MKSWQEIARTLHPAEQLELYRTLNKLSSKLERKEYLRKLTESVNRMEKEREDEEKLRRDSARA